MPNAVEDALSRASAEQKAKNEQVIAEARSNIKLVSMQQMDDISPTGADSIARNAQIIEEAKRNIPFETMQSVDSIGPPTQTPAMGAAGSNVVQLHPETQANIESIEQSGGNNYQNDNAIDRAQAREPQPSIEPQQQQERSR